jgi:hypothetical protein
MVYAGYAVEAIDEYTGQAGLPDDPPPAHRH